jgi:hypothetical protein
MSWWTTLWRKATINPHTVLETLWQRAFMQSIIIRISVLESNRFIFARWPGISISEVAGFIRPRHIYSSTSHRVHFWNVDQSRETFWIANLDVPVVKRCLLFSYSPFKKYEHSSFPLKKNYPMTHGRINPAPFEGRGCLRRWCNLIQVLEQLPKNGWPVSERVRINGLGRGGRRI